MLCSRDIQFANTKAYSATEWGVIAERLRQLNMRPAEIWYANSDTIELFKGTAVYDRERLDKLFERQGSMRPVVMKYDRWNIKVVTIADPEYPQTLINNLKSKAPPVLCCFGNIELLNKPAIGMVGSRRIDENDAAFLKKIAETATANGNCIVSGGAIGSDRVSETSALSCNGSVVSYVAEPFHSTHSCLKNKEAIEEGRLLLVSAHSPKTVFSAPVALERNRYIYAHSIATVISKSDLNKGGTWHGAKDALRLQSCPIYVNGNTNSLGNRALITNGATAITEDWNPLY